MSYNIINVIKDIFTGNLRFVNKSLARDRLEICKNCEVLNKKVNVCTICGCQVNLKTKLEKSSCPMELW